MKKSDPVWVWGLLILILGMVFRFHALPLAERAADEVRSGQREPLYSITLDRNQQPFWYEVAVEVNKLIPIIEERSP